MSDLVVKFANPEQREFYYATERNQCFSSGFNAGKTFIACLKILTLLTTFPKYKVIIARQTYSDLKRTTMQTFFKLCPKKLVVRHNEQDGTTELANGSVIHWMHLDNVDESSLRGLEINSVLVDQAEEIDEKVYDVLDSRIGRWDEAIVPRELLKVDPSWPANELTGKHIVPSYIMLLCNPDSQFHFIFRHYHPDSLERKPNHFYIEREWDSSLGSKESYDRAIARGEEWVNKYVRGQWGYSVAQIHVVTEASILEYSEELLTKIFRKGNLYRSLDHGDASATCCLWWAAFEGVHICYREYYLPNDIISNHRKNISELSQKEAYSANYADPSIFSKASKAQGGFWSVADEYVSADIDAPRIAWVPADNNEFATRNRINELLRISDKHKHPLTGETPAPGLYFIRKTANYQFGCYQAINQMRSQRRKLEGYVDGKAVYSDERDDKIIDHAYDPTRYYISMHGSSKVVPVQTGRKRTFNWYMKLRKQNAGKLVPTSVSHE